MRGGFEATSTVDNTQLIDYAMVTMCILSRMCSSRAQNEHNLAHAAQYEIPSTLTVEIARTHAKLAENQPRKSAGVT